MKEPGQIAYETFRDLVPAHFPWDEIAPSVKAYWAAVEAACRAEGMREAARIAAKFSNGSAEWARHATAIEAAIRAIAEAKRHAQFWKDAAPTGGAYLESASQGAARVADGIASMEPLEGQYHPIGYWDWHTGAFHKPDKLTPALQKMIELGRLRTCYVKYDSTEMPPRPVHVGIKPPGQS